MAGKSVTEGTVFLDGKIWDIGGDVARFLASRFPEKLVLGDYTVESHPLVSTITWGDLTGGMLKETADLPGDGRRTFQNGLNSLFSGHTYLPVEAQAVGDNGFSAATDVYGMVRYQGNNYAQIQEGPSSASSFAVVRFDVTGHKATLSSSATPTDFFSGRLGSQRVLISVSADQMNWTHSDTNDSVWFTDSSQPITHVKVWNDVLWGINDSAELFFTPSLSSAGVTWTKTAQADLESTGQQTGLVVGPDDRLYLVSRRGLHRYDNEAERLTHIFDVPGSSMGGNAFDVWQGSIFYADRRAIWRVTPTPEGNVAQPVGLDQDDGLRGGILQSVRALNHSLRELLAQSSVAVYGWNEQAWGTVYQGTGVDAAGRSLIVVPDGTGDVRLHTSLLGSSGASDGVAGISLDDRYTPPSQAAGLVGFVTGESSQNAVTLPWVAADQPSIALSVSVQHSFINPGSSLLTSSQLMRVEYGTDYQSSFTALGTVNALAGSGRTDLPFPDEGLPYSAIRLRVQMETDFALISPDLKRLSLHFRKNIDTLWGFRVHIKAQGSGRRTPLEIRRDLEALFDKETLLEFAYHDNATSGGPQQTFYVAPLALESAEGTGYAESGDYILTLAEVR